MKKPTKAIPLGKPLDTDDAALDMLALVTIEDIEAAKADGRARMGRVGRGMLEAERAERVDAADEGATGRVRDE